MQNNTNDEIQYFDSNNEELFPGDSVTLIKDLKVKNSSETLKQGTVFKNIQPGDDEEHVRSKSLFLKTCFLKKKKMKKRK